MLLRLEDVPDNSTTQPREAKQPKIVTRMGTGHLVARGAFGVLVTCKQTRPERSKPTDLWLMLWLWEGNTSGNSSETDSAQG